jgi:hypothetical protein
MPGWILVRRELHAQRLINRAAIKTPIDTSGYQLGIAGKEALAGSQMRPQATKAQQVVFGVNRVNHCQPCQPTFAKFWLANSRALFARIASRAR